MFLGIPFYFHILNGDYEFGIPKTFSMDGTKYIPNDIILQRQAMLDEFSLGIKTIAAGGKHDEAADEVLCDRELNIDRRERIKIEDKKDNFVVVIESLHNNVRTVGSGTLFEYFGWYFVFLYHFKIVLDLILFSKGRYGSLFL